METKKVYAAPALALAVLVSLTLLAASPSAGIAMQLLVVALAIFCSLQALLGANMYLSFPVVSLFVFTLIAILFGLPGPGGLQATVKAAAFGSLLLVGTYFASTHSAEITCRVAFFQIPALISIASLVVLAIAPSVAFPQFGDTRRLTIPFLNTHPNTLGALAALGILSALWRAASGVEKWRYVIGIVCIHSFVIALTYSRSAILDVIVGIIAWAYVSKSQFRTLGTVALLATLGLATFGDSVVQVLLRDQTSAQFAEFSGRAPIWQAGLEAWTTNPISGSGYGAGAGRAVNDSGLYLSYNVSTTDNFPLDALIEVGLLGGITVVIAYLSSIQLVRRARSATARYGQPTRTGSGHAIIVVCVILFHGLGAGGLGRFHVLLLFLALGLGIMAKNISDSREDTIEHEEKGAKHTVSTKGMNGSTKSEYISLSGRWVGE